MTLRPRAQAAPGARGLDPVALLGAGLAVLLVVLAWLRGGPGALRAHVDMNAGFLAALDCLQRSACLTQVLATDSPSAGGVSHGAMVNHVTTLALALTGDPGSLWTAGLLSIASAAALVFVAAHRMQGALAGVVAVALFLASGPTHVFLRDHPWVLLWHFVPPFAALAVVATLAWSARRWEPLLWLAAVAASVAWQFHLTAFVLLPGVLAAALLAPAWPGALLRTFVVFAVTSFVGSPGVFLGARAEGILAAVRAQSSQLPLLWAGGLSCVLVGLWAARQLRARRDTPSADPLLLALLLVPGLVFLLPGVNPRYAIVVDAPLAIAAGAWPVMVLRRLVPRWGAPGAGPAWLRFAPLSLLVLWPLWPASLGGFPPQKPAPGTGLERPRAAALDDDRMLARALWAAAPVRFASLFQQVRTSPSLLLSLANGVALEWPLVEAPLPPATVALPSISVLRLAHADATPPGPWTRVVTGASDDVVFVVLPGVVAGPGYLVLDEAGQVVGPVRSLRPPFASQAESAYIYRGAPQSFWSGAATDPAASSADLRLALPLLVPVGLPPRMLRVPDADPRVDLSLTDVRGVRVAGTLPAGSVLVSGDAVDREGWLVVRARARDGVTPVMTLLALMVPVPLELPPDAAAGLPGPPMPSDPAWRVEPADPWGPAAFTIPAEPTFLPPATWPRAWSLSMAVGAVLALVAGLVTSLRAVRAPSPPPGVPS